MLLCTSTNSQAARVTKIGEPSQCAALASCNSPQSTSARAGRFLHGACRPVAPRACGIRWHWQGGCNGTRVVAPCSQCAIATALQPKAQTVLYRGGVAGGHTAQSQKPLFCTTLCNTASKGLAAFPVLCCNLLKVRNRAEGKSGEGGLWLSRGEKKSTCRTLSDPLHRGVWWLAWGRLKLLGLLPVPSDFRASLVLHSLLCCHALSLLLE